MSCTAQRPTARTSVLVVVAVVLAGLVPVAPCAAAGDAGAAARAPILRDPSVRYRPPVRSPVLDPFRQPAGPYGPGNRGLEYRTAPGSPVRAIGDGVVAFAGQVAGRLVISIDHPDGLRSSLVDLAAITVRPGQRVRGGDVVGRSLDRLHLGVRRDGRYLDPATLFVDRAPARLVPLLRAGAGFGGAQGPH